MKKSLLSFTLVTIAFLAGCSGGSSNSGGGGNKVTLKSISIAPTNPTVTLAGAPPAATMQFAATGIYSDGSSKTLTQVTWGSSNTVVASISGGGLATAVTAGSTMITAASGSVSGNTTLSVNPVAVSLVSITVSPASPSIARGTTQQFIATGNYSDGSTKNLTSQVTWSSSMTGIASISASGLASGAGVGGTTITATLGSVSGNTTLTVTSATLVSIAVTPGNASVPLGTLQQYTAIGTFSDNTTQDLTSSATWNSSATNIATITGSGLLTGRGLGSSTIKATFGSISGSTGVDVNAANVVSVTLQPANATIANGTNLQYTAIATFNDGSTLNVTFTSGINWTSSTSSIATIGPTNGLAVSKGVGNSMIGVSFATFSDSAMLNVSNATIQSISISPANTTIAPGTTQRFVATGTFSDGSTQNITTVSNWQSSNTAAATVSNSVGNYGLATGIAMGSSNISASFTSPAGPSASGSTLLSVNGASLQSISLTPTSSTIAAPATVQYTALGSFSNGTVQNLNTVATWNSSQSGVATVSSSGTATGVSGGTTKVTASLGAITSNAASLTVTSSPLVSLAVSCTAPQIAQGTSENCTAIGTLQDGSTQNLTQVVNWTSSNGSVATVSNSTGIRGQVTGVSAGTTTLTAYTNGIVGTGTLDVSNAAMTSITVSPSNPSISLGSTQGFTAVGHFNDGTTQSLTSFVTWSSSNPSVAIISGAGVATSSSSGTTTISATLNGVTGTATLTVN